MSLRLDSCLALHWSIWRDKGADPWVVEVLREGYSIPFSNLLPLSVDSISFDSYSPIFIKGKALPGEILSLIEKGAVELAPSSPGYYSCMFVVMKASGSWRPIIDLSILNKFILQTKFKMETNQSVLRAVLRGDWMVSIYLQDTYLQIPIHLESRKFLLVKPSLSYSI